VLVKALTAAGIGSGLACLPTWKSTKEAKSSLLSFVEEQPNKGLAERNQSSLFAYQAVSGANRANWLWNGFMHGCCNAHCQCISAFTCFVV
jgi:hypothetical protein